MTRADRTGRIREMMRDRDWDLLVCSLPANVLMLSGYWPIVGTGVACVNRNGEVKLLVPRDEEELARNDLAVEHNEIEIATFESGSLEHLDRPARTIQKPLARLVGLKCSRIAWESGEVSEPASYAAMHLYKDSMPGLLGEVFPAAKLEPADQELATLRAVKTDVEIAHIRAACKTAARAFEEGARKLHPGLEEIDAAQNFRRELACSEASRADGFVSCMSGVNSGHAYGAFARSTHKKIARGDLVLTHCNSYEDGFWTDVTRTYVMGDPDPRQQKMYTALRAAYEAAFQAVTVGAAAAKVDHAARETLAAHGFGAEFKHSTGHGVGFGAIDAHALPRLHPKSPDRLETGMVFNIEPGIYFPDFGGMRHCDMVALTTTGPQLMTTFQPVEMAPVEEGR